MQILKINRNDAGQRLDKFLSKAVKGLPTSMMYKYIRLKKIKVNRARTAPNYQLAEGDEIQLFIRDEFFSAPADDVGALYRIEPKISILYEDENILLLNKRPGVLVHEDATAGENTLILHVKAYLAQKGEYDPRAEQSFAPALCNRIDRNTGGIVIAAKNAEALRIINEKIRDREIDKEYLTVVHGRPNPPAGRIESQLFKDAERNLVLIKKNREPGTRTAVTERTGRMKAWRSAKVPARSFMQRPERRAATKQARASPFAMGAVRR